ncbi:hypothetical protein KOXY103107_11625 [Komagataeibacter xylinus]
MKSGRGLTDNGRQTPFKAFGEKLYQRLAYDCWLPSRLIHAWITARR